MGKQPRFKLAVLSGLILLALGGCRSKPLQGDIADLRRLPQTARYYLDPATADKPLMTPAVQHQESQRFLEIYFSPWQLEVAAPPEERVFQPLHELMARSLHGANLLPYRQEELRRLTDKCAVENFPAETQRAISIRHTHIRALPTDKPGFADPLRAGEGFPFDYFQYSALRADTPARILHRSRNGAWSLVMTPHVSGWVPSSDLALVDEDFVAAFQTGSYLAVIREETFLSDLSGEFHRSLSIGALLPRVGTNSLPGQVLTAAADGDGKAVLRTAIASPEAVAAWPLPATAAVVAELLEQLIGQSYGWGGLYGGRDCSATLQDLFAVIGLSLPRNSARQITAGQPVDLRNLAPAAREKLLIQEGRPFFTLVGLPGHIMLYLGHTNGEAVVAHTLWGLRTRSYGRGEERHLIGRTVITSLQPGRELRNLKRPDGLLRRRLEAFTLLEQGVDPGD